METWNNGPHLLELESPDIFHCHVRAPVEENEAKETLRVVMEELGAKRGLRVFFISHMEFNGTTPFTPAAKKWLSTQSPGWKSVIIVGGTPLTRAMSNIIFKGMMLFSNQKVPFKMVKSLDEAREFIAELREHEAANAAPSKG